MDRVGLAIIGAFLWIALIVFLWNDLGCSTATPC